MQRRNRLSFLLLPGIFVTASFVTASSAHGAEVFGGIFAHDVKTGITKSGIEEGTDFQIGLRGRRIDALSFIGSPQPHLFASVNTGNGVNFAATGFSWKIGRRVYVRPGIGLAIHDGPGDPASGSRRIDFGSRILFEPEIGIGVDVSDRFSIEASWVHLSHATLFSGNNPGIDNIGVRINYHFR